MAKIIIIFLFFLCKPATSLKETLVRDKFYEGSGIHFLEIKFNQDDSYTATYSSEGINWSDTGNYSIASSKIFLVPKHCKDSAPGQIIDCKKSLGKATCILEKYKESFSHEFLLTCVSNDSKELLLGSSKKESISFSLPLESSVYPEGIPITYQSVDSLTMGRKSATVNQNAKLREIPSIAGKIIRYSENVYNGPHFEYIPKGTGVTVWLKTKDKEQSKNRENHWYFIKSGDSYGWVFGDFLKF